MILQSLEQLFLSILPISTDNCEKQSKSFYLFMDDFFMNNHLILNLEVT